MARAAAEAMMLIEAGYWLLRVWLNLERDIFRRTRVSPGSMIVLE
jgi:hypothetical protein